MSNPRNANGAARRAQRRRVAASCAPCWICGLAIDYSLRTPHPRSFELDELQPVSKGGSPIDPRNLDATHRICNQWRSDKSVAAVVRIRAAARAMGFSWDTPEHFVAAAKGIARAPRRAEERARDLAAGLRSSFDESGGD